MTHYSGGDNFLKLEYGESGIPVLAKGDIKPFGRVEHGGRFVSREIVERRKYRTTVPGDYLLTTRDLTQAADFLGLLAPVPTDRGYLVNQGANIVRFGPAADGRFIVYWCNGPMYRAHMKSHYVGSTQIHIRKDDFLDAPLLLPPLDEQRAISATLGALDDKIDANDRVMAALEHRLAAIFAAERFDEADGDAIPLSDIVNVNPATPGIGTGDAPYVDMSLLPTRSALVAKAMSRRPKSGSRFLNGDTLMARITPCLENGKVAYMDCLRSGQTGAGSTEFIVLRPIHPVPSQFAYLLARSTRFTDFAVRHMSGSSGRQRCPVDAVAGYPINRPSPVAIARLTNEAQPSFAAMRAALDESLALSRLRDALLPSLLSGNVRVRVAEELLGESV